jgi:hypothetical protein
MTNEDIIRMAREAGLWPSVTDILLDELERFANLVVEVEREACVNKLLNDGWGYAAKTIRARGQS